MKNGKIIMNGENVGAGPVSAQKNINKTTKPNANPVGACIARPQKYKYYERGITLIALIITIIIMLILAGVVLSLTIGEHGIFKLAQNAGKNYTEAEKKEQEELDKLYKELGLDPLPENTKDTKAGTPVQMPKSWYRETPVKVSDKTGVEIVKTTLVASVEAVSDGKENTIPIPKGFYYVGGTKNSGVVISDNPADKNKFAGREDIPSGASYNEDGTVNIEASELKGNQFVWVPCEISNYKKTDFGLANGGWLTTTPTSEEIQVQKYGGFYCRQI